MNYVELALMGCRIQKSEDEKKADNRNLPPQPPVHAEEKEKSQDKSKVDIYSYLHNGCKKRPSGPIAHALGEVFQNQR